MKRCETTRIAPATFRHLVSAVPGRALAIPPTSDRAPAGLPIGSHCSPSPAAPRGRRPGRASRSRRRRRGRRHRRQDLSRQRQPHLRAIDFISTMIGMSGYRRARRAATECRCPAPERHAARCSVKRKPASTRDSSAAVRAGTGPDASVVRSSVSSWQTTTTPSGDRCTSISSPSAPAARPRSKAAIVFSGPSAQPPR